MSLIGDFAIALAYKAGAIIRDNFSLNMQKEWKEDGSPTVVTDKRINDLILREIIAQYPDDAILSEEGSLENPESEYTWVCDPLDGTIPFSHGIPTCVFSLAYLYRGIPILGVVYDPFMDRLFYGEKSCGAFLNGVPIQVSKKNDLPKALIGIGYAWNQINLLSAIGALIEHRAITVQFASNVYMGSLVAGGEFLAVYFGGKFPWDVAALKIIVEEAGGRVTDLQGSEQRYDQEIRGALISNGCIHDQLLTFVNARIGT